MGEGYHIPVLAGDVAEMLDPRSGQCWFDGTLGGGGHAELILGRITAGGAPGRLWASDRDPEAVAFAAARLARFGSALTIWNIPFSQAATQLEASVPEGLDGVLLDLGISSHQIDDPTRGMTLREDAPLDLRMDPRQGRPMAACWEEFDQGRLATILKEYGDLPQAGRVARALLQATPQTTRALRETVDRVLPPKGERRLGHANRVVQALRIEINDEFGELARGVPVLFERLKVGGRMGIITFHSGEDRWVKRFFHDLLGRCTCPPQMPVCGCGAHPQAVLLGERTASQQELALNPRARSARLRGVQRVAPQP